VPSESERQAARSVVGEYHDAQLRKLVEHVADAIDRYRAGDLNAFEVDHIVFQYFARQRNYGSSATISLYGWRRPGIRERPPSDWWERGAPRER
jgi:hypothetical protein